MKKTSILILIAAFLMAAVLLCNEAGLFAAILPDAGLPSVTSDPGAARTSPVSAEQTEPISTFSPEDTDAPPETQGSGAVITSSAETGESFSTSVPETSPAPQTSELSPVTDPPVTTDPKPVTTAAETQPAEPKPVVGISSTNGNVKAEPASYAAAARNAGFEVKILPFVTTRKAALAQLATVDALIMTGGDDIAPSYYGEKVISAALLDISPARDTSDFLYIQTALEADLPMLCICRGMQILNVVCGGTLIQDIPLQVPSSAVTHRDPNRSKFLYHTIRTEDNSLLRSILGKSTTVNSWHHQAVGSAGINVRITAYAPDEVVEAIEITGKTFAVGLQFHPEEYAKSGNKTFLKFFTSLRDAIPTPKTGV